MGFCGPEAIEALALDWAMRNPHGDGVDGGVPIGEFEFVATAAAERYAIERERSSRGNKAIFCFTGSDVVGIRVRVAGDD